MTITHAMGNTPPPASRKLTILEWASKLPGDVEPKEKTVMLPPGWEVRKNGPFRDGYWTSHKMHTEFAALCRDHGVPLPTLFVIILGGNPVGFGNYGSEDPADRAFFDTAIQEAEWEMRGTGHVPMIAVNLDNLPPAALAEFTRRTGSQQLEIGAAIAAEIAVEQEHIIAETSASIGRACGTCTLCCKLFAIENVAGFTKPADEWCQHCAVGKGCKIYGERPMACRAFTCQWLIDPEVGDHWFPAKAKMVLRWIDDPTKPYDIMEVSVDTGFPNRWREEPWLSDLHSFAARGLNRGRLFLVHILSGGMRRWMVLPTKVVPYSEASILIRNSDRGRVEWDIVAVEGPQKAALFALGGSADQAKLQQILNEARAN